MPKKTLKSIMNRFKKWGNKFKKTGKKYIKTYKGKSKGVRGGLGTVSMTSRKDPLPPRWRCKFVCSHSGQLTSTNLGTGGTEILYRLGSIYDPTFAIGGRQPYGRDVMATIYNKYRVNACKVELLLTDPSADGVNFIGKFSNPADTTATNGKTINQLCDTPNTVIIPMNNSGAQVRKYVKYIPLWKLFGVTKADFEADDNYEALMTTNPNFDVHIRLNACNTISGVQANIINYVITETFYTQLFDRVPIPDDAV